jgi:hypothetical protein
LSTKCDSLCTCCVREKHLHSLRVACFMHQLSLDDHHQKAIPKSSNRGLIFCTPSCFALHWSAMYSGHLSRCSIIYAIFSFYKVFPHPNFFLWKLIKLELYRPDVMLFSICYYLGILLACSSKRRWHAFDRRHDVMAVKASSCLQLRIYKTCVHLRCHVFTPSCQDGLPVWDCGQRVWWTRKVQANFFDKLYNIWPNIDMVAALKSVHCFSTRNQPNYLF